jgi:HlyD family secretion protein
MMRNQLRESCLAACDSWLACGTSLSAGSLAAATLALGLATGCQQPIPAAAAQVAAERPAAGGALEKVTAGEPVRRNLHLFSTQPARLVPLEQTPVHARISGYVGKVHVDVGDKVDAGDELVTLDVPELAVEVAQKQALLEQAAAERKQADSAKIAAQAQLATAQALVRQAEAGVARVAADIARWQSEYSRLEQLANSGSLNRQVVDETRQKLAAAEAAGQEVQAAVDSAAAAARQAEAELAKADADIVAAAARERVAAENLRYSETMLGYGRLTAPFAGVITQRRVDPGHFTTGAGGEPLLVVMRNDIVRVLIAIPENETPLVDIGDEVNVVVPSLRGRKYTGKVSRTAWSLDEGNRSLVTIVDLPNEDGALRPGMYATTQVLLAARENVLTLPAAAVKRDGGEACCFIVHGGKAVRTPIELGLKVGDDWEIVKGLEGNESVCLTKASSLADGQAIDVLPVAPQP